MKLRGFYVTVDLAGICTWIPLVKMFVYRIIIFCLLVLEYLHLFKEQGRMMAPFHFKNFKIHVPGRLKTEM